MRMRGGVTSWDEKLCACLRSHIALLIKSVRVNVQHHRQRPQTSAPSEFFFSYLFTLIRIYRLPPSASARNHVHNLHPVSFLFLFSSASSVSTATHTQHIRTQSRQPSVTSRFQFHSFLFLISLPSSAHVHHHPSSASTAHAHTTHPHTIAPAVHTQ